MPRTYVRQGPIYTMYRFFDKKGQLLYAGCTVKMSARVSEHRMHTHWWSEVDRATFVHYGTWAEARAAEHHAIVTENPKYNIQDAKDAQRKRDRRGTVYQGLPGLRRIRCDAGYTKTELARIVNCHQTMLSKIEVAERNASRDLAQRLAKALNCTVDDLKAA